MGGGWWEGAYKRGVISSSLRYLNIAQVDTHSLVNLFLFFSQTGSSEI